MYMVFRHMAFHCRGLHYNVLHCTGAAGIALQRIAWYHIMCTHYTHDKARTLCSQIIISKSLNLSSKAQWRILELLRNKYVMNTNSRHHGPIVSRLLSWLCNHCVFDMWCCQKTNGWCHHVCWCEYHRCCYNWYDYDCDIESSQSGVDNDLCGDMMSVALKI